MKKYGILLSAEEHKKLKTVAAQRGLMMQDIARDAVISAIEKVQTGPTLVRKDETPPSDLVKQLSSLQALAEQLAAGIKDAATNTRGLIDARNTNDAGPAGRARVEADVLRAVAEADRSAGAAIKDTAPRRRRSKGHDTGAA